MDKGCTWAFRPLLLISVHCLQPCFNVLVLSVWLWGEPDGRAGLVFFWGERCGGELMFLPGYFSCESIPQWGLQHGCITVFLSYLGFLYYSLRVGMSRKRSKKVHKQSSFIDVSFGNRWFPWQHGKPGEKSVLWKKLWLFFSLSSGREEARVILSCSCTSASYVCSYVTIPLNITQLVVWTLKRMVRIREGRDLSTFSGFQKGLQCESYKPHGTSSLVSVFLGFGIMRIIACVWNIVLY